MKHSSVIAAVLFTNFGAWAQEMPAAEPAQPRQRILPFVPPISTLDEIMTPINDTLKRVGCTCIEIPNPDPRFFTTAPANRDGTMRYYACYRSNSVANFAGYTQGEDLTQTQAQDSCITGRLWDEKNEPLKVTPVAK